MSDDWKNLVYEALAEHGKDVEKMKANEFESIPEPGFFSGLSLSFKTNVIKGIFFYRSFFARRRLTHKQGIGAVGTAIVIADPKFPPNDFFRPNREFSVRLRHANLTLDDDRSLDVRAASIKFADAEEGGPLDLIMNTGRACPFWNGPTVKDFMASKAGKKELQDWLFKNSAYYRLAVESSRRAPSSYTKLSYYSQMTMELIDEMGKKHHARFRLIPHDYTGQDDGMPDKRDQYNYADECDVPRDGDERPPDYLKQAIKSHLSDGGQIHYVIQIQVRDVIEGESLEVFNMGKAWDLEKSPWLDLAHVTLNGLLDPIATERLQFNVANSPKCLVLPDAPSFEDYRSIGHLRRAIYSADQSGRLMRFRGAEDLK